LRCVEAFTPRKKRIECNFLGKIVKKIFLVLFAMLLANAGWAQSSRRVATDDASGFNDRFVREASGVLWNGNFSNWRDVRNDGATGVRQNFDLNFGVGTVPSSGSIQVTENGNLDMGGLGIIELFKNADLVSSNQFGVPVIGDQTSSYALGHVYASSGSRLAEKGGGGFYADLVAPGGESAYRRITWFGLTDPGAGGSCDDEQLTIIKNDINFRQAPNTFAGTSCAEYLSTKRYFGQVELHKVGLRADGTFDILNDGDFDLFLGFRAPGLNLFCPDGTLQCTGKTGNYPGSASGGGFTLGLQQYLFTAADVINDTVLNHFRFRSGVGCAVTLTDCVALTMLDGGGGGLIPVPGIVALLALGGLALSRSRKLQNS
jgi:hypothetical protein